MQATFTEATYDLLILSLRHCRLGWWSHIKLILNSFHFLEGKGYSTRCPRYGTPGPTHCSTIILYIPFMVGDDNWSVKHGVEM